MDIHVYLNVYLFVLFSLSFAGKLLFIFNSSISISCQWSYWYTWFKRD